MDKMSAFKKMQAVVANEIHAITIQNISKLSDIWLETFELPVCEGHLKKLSEHINLFYDEVISETEERRKCVQDDVQNLMEEAANLRRLLHVDVILSPQKDIPLYTLQMQLDESLQHLREKLKNRKDQIYELLLEQETLCEELDEPPRPLLDDPLPTEDELGDFILHLETLKGEKVNRQYEISNLRREVKSYLSELELSVESPAEDALLKDRHIPLTKSTINQLRELREHYSKTMDDIRNTIEKTKIKLENLWDCLDTSPSVRQKFAKYKNYSQTTFDKYYQELQRCEAQKCVHIKKFVDKIRKEIVEWWDKTLKSEIEKSRFSNFTNDCYTEDLLALHEMELEDLKNFYHNNKQIFDLIDERKVLWERMIALDAKASEPGRYNNRGGELLKEEKERKLIATKLPKIEDHLVGLVRTYETENSIKFLVYGEDILQIIERDWKLRQEEKEKMMSARKRAVNTPLSKTMTRTPLSVRNQSTLKRVPSSRNVSSVPLSSTKRKLPTDSLLPPCAKRSLLTELASPNNFIRPHASKAHFKSPLKKNRVIATTIKRKSGRLSGNTKNKKRFNKTPVKIPKITLSKENTLTSDTMTYDVFEEHIGKDSRSSILTTTNRNAASRLPDPRLARTPSKINIQDRKKKSPHSSRTASPMAGPSNRKLTTKNLPLLI